MSDSLPPGWTNAALEDLIVEIVGGGTPSKARTDFFAGTIPFMTVKDMNTPSPSDTIDHITDEALRSSSSRLIPAETMIVASRMSLGKAVRPTVPVAINQDLKALFFGEGVDVQCMAHWWRSRAAEIESLGTGTTVKGIRLDDIRGLSVAVPPANEQRRIADKLDQTLAIVERALERLRRVPEILKRFRQSVLAAATDGRLTEDWRAEQTARMQPQAESAHCVRDSAELSYTISVTLAAPVLPVGDAESPSNIGWTYERAVDVCAKVQSGGTPKEGFTSAGIPFLKVYNIVNQQVDFDYRPQYIDPAIHHGSMSKSKVFPGDVLMNIVGPPLGKVAVVPDTHPAWNINQAITLFRPSARVKTKWLYYVLCSGKNITDIVHETKGSAGQSNISLSQCRDFIFPVPPMDEQTEIVRRVEALFALADRIEARHRAALARVDKLTQALLAKAFRGELVPQDPADEPAAALLERIRAARAAAPYSRKRGRAAVATP